MLDFNWKILYFTLIRTLKLTYIMHFLSNIYNTLFQSTEPEIPIYETLDLQMKGYDFVVLESFAKYVGALSRSFDLPYE